MQELIIISSTSTTSQDSKDIRHMQLILIMPLDLLIYRSPGFIRDLSYLNYSIEFTLDCHLQINEKKSKIIAKTLVTQYYLKDRIKNIICKE